MSEIFPDGLTKALSQLGRILEPMSVYPLVFSAGGVISLAAGQILLTVIIISAAIFFRDSSKKGLSQFLMLPSDFGVSASDILAANVKNIDEAVKLSKSAGVFCLHHDIDRKRSLQVSLCIEELCMNALRHGFKGGEQYNLDARLIAYDGGLILRLRDDCMPFDVKKMADEWKYNPGNPEHHIGTRLVMKHAEDIHRVSIMNTNSLIVIL